VTTSGEVSDAFLEATKALDLEVERRAVELGVTPGEVLYGITCSWVNRKLEATGLDLDKHPRGHASVRLSEEVIDGLDTAADGLSSIGAALEVIERRRR